MKRNILVIAFAIIISLITLRCDAQDSNSKNLAVGFYNLENFFDTIHDEGKNDSEFLPGGKNDWNTQKYNFKKEHISKTLFEMGTDKVSDGCFAIGVSEIENANVLNDLINSDNLKSRGYKYCHIEGPDERGIDCALLYNPEIFDVENVKLVPYQFWEGCTDVRPTRYFLTVCGNVNQEKFAMVVCHLPSRYASGEYRQQGGKLLKNIKDSLFKIDPNYKILIMGDMNDDPSDTSIAVSFGAKQEIKDVAKGEFYNPWWNTLNRDNNGSLYYRGKWNLFDQILISSTLVDNKGYKYKGNEIFKRDYLIQQDGKYKGAPMRTFAGKNWLNGYSDHLPVVIYLEK